MHGRPRESLEAKEERRKAEQAKADSLRSARRAVLDPSAQPTPREMLQVTAALVEVNPDAYTAWNRRREAIERSDASATTSEEELSLVERALKRQPKAYPAWHHRRYAIDMAGERMDWQRELELCNRLLSMDMRNMHCWAHRQFACYRMGRRWGDELAWTLRKIRENFSNFSAWHARAMLLQQSGCDTCYHAPAYACRECNDAGIASGEALTEELHLANEAGFTDPTDESPWLYIACLEAMAHDTADTRSAFERQEARCRELVAMEPDAKWPLVTLARLSYRNQGPSRENLALYERLQSVDPLRSGFYSDMAARIRSQMPTSE